MDEARGGVLFIDEAYALGGSDMYCKNARDTLVQLMTDERYKGSTIVIIAGYKMQMQEMMVLNPGFAGRFGSALHFQDWDANELSSLVISQLEKGPSGDLPYMLDNPAVIKASLDDFFPKLRAHNSKIFSNARDAVEMCKLVIMQYSIRCGSATPFPPVSVADVEAAAKAFLNVRVASQGRDSEAEAAGGGGTATELYADRDNTSFATRERHRHKQADGDAPALVDDDTLTADKDLDFLKDHLKAVDERLRSAQGMHKSCLNEERNRVIDKLKKIAELKRLGDEAAAKKKLEEEKQRLKLMQQIREKICTMGRCPMDYAWRWEGNQFHCEGGSHYATPEELGVSAADCINFFSKTGVMDT